MCEHGLTDGLPKAIGAFNKAVASKQPDALEHRLPQDVLLGRPQSFARKSRQWPPGPAATWAQRIAKPRSSAKINALQGYRSQFQKVFGGEATAENMMQAISAYERTITSGDTAWDRWQAGDQSAASEAAKRGFEVFKTAKCNNCHDGVLFTDQQFHNVGIGMDARNPTRAASMRTKKDEDTGAFMTPTLRDIASQLRYFHDGSVATLEEAVDLMLGGGKPNQYLDKKNLEKRTITPEQRRDLLEFLRSLNVDCRLKEPPLPQK